MMLLRYTQESAQPFIYKGYALFISKLEFIENHGNIFVADVLKAGFRLSLIRRNFKNCLMHPKGYCSKYCPKCSLHSIFPPYQVSMFSLV